MDHGTRLDIPPLRADGLQLEEPRGKQRRYWRVQRIAWWGFGGVMLLAVLGLTGSGGAFQQQTIRFETAEVELPRVSRWEGSDGMTVTFTAPAEVHEITIAQPFFDTFGIERIQPEPDQTLLATDGQTLRFPAQDAPPHEVTFNIRAMHFGWSSFEMTVAGQSRRVNLIVLP